MGECEYNDHVQAVLEQRGFSVDPVCVSATERRADFLASRAGDVYVIEVKGRALSGFEQTLLDDAHTGVGGSGMRDLKRGNSLSAAIEEAATQLAATPAPVGSIPIVWLPCLHHEASFLLDQAVRTLYGIKDVWIEGPERRGVPCAEKICFFADFSDFFRFNAIAAAVLSTSSVMRFCINPFSSQLSQIRASELLGEFDPCEVWDPQDLEQSGRAFVVDGNVDRKDERAVLKAISEKYGVRVIFPRTVEIATRWTVRAQDLEGADEEQSN